MFILHMLRLTVIKSFKCIPITFQDHIKACFSNKKYIVSIQTCPTKIGNNWFLIAKQVLMGSLKIIGVQNQLPFSFGTVFVCSKILKVRDSPPKHTIFLPLVSFYTLNL